MESSLVSVDIAPTIVRFSQGKTARLDKNCGALPIAEQRGGLKHCAAITSSRSRSVGLRSKRKSASGLSGACGAWCAQVLLRRRAARPAGSAALADSVHDVRGSTHDARVPRGTRGTVRTSPRRLNEASPKLSMTVGEQLPPARTVAGSADRQGTVVLSSRAVTLRESDDRRRDVHGWSGSDINNAEIIFQLPELRRPTC